MQKVEIKLTDRKVAKAQQNKMAGSSGESDKILIQSLKENAVNKNTLQSTNMLGKKSGSLGLLKRDMTKALKSTN